MLTKNFESRLKAIGRPDVGEAPSDQAAAYIEKSFPMAYRQFVWEFGLASFFEQGFQLCDPSQFRPLAALIFKADADFSHSNCHLAGFNVWGELYFWSEQHWLTKVDLLKYEVRAIRLAPNELGGPPIPKRGEPTPDQISVQLLPREKEDRELWDWQNNPMFADAVQGLGALEHGECFGFVPSLGIVGFNSRQRTIENVRKFPALEHFSLIAQMQDFNLVRTVRGKTEMVRPIG